MQMTTRFGLQMKQCNLRVIGIIDIPPKSNDKFYVKDTWSCIQLNQATSFICSLMCGSVNSGILHYTSS